MAALRRMLATADSPSHEWAARRLAQAKFGHHWMGTDDLCRAIRPMSSYRYKMLCNQGKGSEKHAGSFPGKKNAALSPCPCLPANSTARHHQCHTHGGWCSLTLLAPGLVPRGGVPFVGLRTISPAPGFRLSRAGQTPPPLNGEPVMEAGPADQTDVFSAASHG